MTGARVAELLALAALGWALAIPVSAWLAGARWTARVPVAALLAWQAVGLGGGLAVLTSELTLAAADEPGPWRHAVADAVTDPSSGWAFAGLALFTASLAWLAGVLLASFARAIRSRRDHRELLALLAGQPSSSEAAPRTDADIEVIDTATPVAYALPGRAGHAGQVVLSTATAAKLSPAELAAVVAHERAHLRQRHSILVQPFIAWERSLRVLHAPAAARHRVEELVEMACDDAARRVSDPAALRTALTTLAVPGAATDERVRRLAGARRSPAIRAALVVAAAVLVVAPPAILLVLPV